MRVLWNDQSIMASSMRTAVGNWIWTKQTQDPLIGWGVRVGDLNMPSG
jgi:hypothetical protein